MIATIRNIGATESAERMPPAPPSPTTKPPNTFSMVWPASMLANRRTERLIGRVKNEMISIGTSSGSRTKGASGTNSLRKPMPCVMKPVTMTVSDHEQRQRESDGDLARHREDARDQAEEVARTART